MKRIFEGLFLLITVVSLILAALATPIAIGCFFYDWAHEVQPSQAAWSAFVVWLKMLACGVLGGVCYLIALLFAVKEGMKL